MRRKRRERKKYTKTMWSLTFSVHVLFSLSLSCSHLLSHISKLFFWERRKNFFFYSAHYELFVFVCMFLGGGGRESFFFPFFLLTHFIFLNYNIILLLSSFIFPKKEGENFFLCQEFLKCHAAIQRGGVGLIPS